MLVAINISEFSLERFSFGPESDWIKTMVSELELRSETMATKITETEAKTGATSSPYL